VLNCMSITNNLCFGTHSSFGMTLTLQQHQSNEGNSKH